MGINPAMEIEMSRVFFNDIDLLSAWVSAQGWGIENTQLSAGPNELRYDHFAFPELVVSHYCSKQSKQSVFALPDGMALFLIGWSKLPLVWCGRHLPPTLLAVNRSGREHWAFLPAGWDCYACRDSLGMSPYQYILTQKLHAVRRQLKLFELSVTEACILYGFNTPSRFARQYSRLFGELPSATRYPGRRRVA